MTDDQKLQRTEKLRISADEAARHVRNVYLTFLLVAVYVAILVGSTTDEQLLRGSEVPLPVLNVGLPIFGVYIVVPGLFLILHFNLLIQFYLLARKVHEFDQSLDDLQAGADATFQRGLLFPFVLSHMLAGKHHSGLMRNLLHTIVWIPVFLLPTALLIWVQVRFLPYHSVGMTWGHRSAVLIDQVMLLYFVPKILFAYKRWRVWPSGSEPEDKPGRVFAILGLFVGVLIFYFYFLIAVAPGKWIERNTDWPIVADYVFDPPRDFLDREFGRNLDLREKILVREAPPPELLAKYVGTSKGTEDKSIWYYEEERAWLTHAKGLDLQDRDLRGADFFEARLTDVNLRRALLEGANFDGAWLQRADLVDAKLQGAFLGGARLQGAELVRAELQGANLRGAQLQGADLRKARLEGADLSAAGLQGADLRDAWLGGSDLRGADLSLSDLRDVNFDALEDKEWDELVALIRETVPEGDEQKKALDRLKEAREWGTQLDKIDPSQARGAIYLKEGRFADWPDPPDEETYDSNLAPELARLACGDEHIARGIVRRVVDGHDAEPQRDLYPLVAQKLLAEGCAGGQQLPEEVRTELQEIAKPDVAPVE